MRARKAGVLSGMRILLACTALCISAPAGADAPVDPPLQAASFAYRSSHAVSVSPSASFAADWDFRPGEPVPAPRLHSRRELCDTAASVAEANNLPIPFFANLIQQESGFKPHVVSPAGAQGIAQFMPRVAAACGLTNPFDPIHALAVSAKFLAELLQQFGNLGLAAAAYNAGPNRVLNWMAKRGRLPTETRNYVKTITGQPAEQWARSKQKYAEVRMPPHARCPGLQVIEARAPKLEKPETVKVASEAGAKVRKTFALASANREMKLAEAAERRQNVLREIRSGEPRTRIIAALEKKAALSKVAGKQPKSANVARALTPKTKVTVLASERAKPGVRVTVTRTVTVLNAKPVAKTSADKAIAKLAGKPPAAKRVKLANAR